MPETKPCLAGCGKVISREGLGPKHFAAKRYCSRACSTAHRKIRPGGDHDTATARQSRDRSKAAMNAHWQIQKAIAQAKAARIPARASREDEVAAMERFAVERGVTRLAEARREGDPVRATNDKPGVMPGWRW